MRNSFNAPASQAHRSGVLPPWLWLWLIFYIPGIFATIDLIKKNLLIIFTGRDGTSSPIIYNLIERVPPIAETLLDLTLLLGVCAILLPWLRTNFLERQYRLTRLSMLPPTTLPETLQTLHETNAFITSLAPGLLVTFNASAPPIPDYAFVYPIGYRRAGMAISGKLLALWRRQRQAAEAVLLHEIAHYRHGDMLMIGAGSLFETVVRNWIRLSIILTILPLVLLLIIEHILSFQEEISLPLADLGYIIAYQLQQIFTADLSFIFLVFFQSFFWSLVLVVVALIAIWCAELNADRFVMDTTQSTQALFQAMEQHGTSSWRSWLFSGMTHPPTVLRKWLITHSNSTRGLVILLLAFPAAWFLRLIFLCLWAIFYTAPMTPLFIAEELGVGVISFLEGMVPSWLAMAALLLLWPALARYWERFFGRLQTYTGNLRYSAYLLATGFVICICLIGAVLSLFPAPQADYNTGRPTSPASTSNRPSGHFQIGDHVTIGTQWSVTVTGAGVRPTTGLITPRAGYAFLAIDVSVKNISSQSRRLSSGFQFSLQDLRGTAYDQTYVVAAPPPEVATNGQIAVGATAQGQLNYEIPTSLHQFILSFKADWNNYDSATSKMTVWDINTGPTPATTSTIPPSASSYPHLQQAYQGTLTNTTDNANVSASASLSSVQQDQQGRINGYMRIQSPLAGSGPFKGLINQDGTIQFTVTPNDQSGYSAIDFTGSIHQDGSMDGTYSLPGTGQGGTWQFKSG